jgi:hypothetical protein
MKYEHTVVTIEVPWKHGAPWPYLPAQDAILAAMNELGAQGWQVTEHVWSDQRPANDSLPWSVNIWARRVLES